MCLLLLEHVSYNIKKRKTRRKNYEQKLEKREKGKN
jgi:hypothetical protein